MANLTELSEEEIRNYLRLDQTKGAKAKLALTGLSTLYGNACSTCFTADDTSTAHSSFRALAAQISNIERRLDVLDTRIDALVERLNVDVLQAEDSLAVNVLEE